jgi:hypothetical protein
VDRLRRFRLRQYSADDYTINNSESSQNQHVISINFLSQSR